MDSMVQPWNDRGKGPWNDKYKCHPRALKPVTLGLPSLSLSDLIRGAMDSMVQPWNDRGKGPWNDKYKCHPRTPKPVTLGLDPRVHGFPGQAGE